MKKSIILIVSTILFCAVLFAAYELTIRPKFNKSTVVKIDTVTTVIPLTDLSQKTLFANIKQMKGYDSTYKVKIFAIPGFKALNEQFEVQVKALNERDVRDKLGMIPAPHNVKPEDILNLQFDGKNLLLKYKK